MDQSIKELMRLDEFKRQEDRYSSIKKPQSYQTVCILYGHFSMTYPTSGIYQKIGQKWHFLFAK